ncbi:hypothetical protein QJS66_17850 [Kocuria rhizophila]|nr:hypothetical protein QJS66_17850 [Kocuria rhizophila]
MSSMPHDDGGGSFLVTSSHVTRGRGPPVDWTYAGSAATPAQGRAASPSPRALQGGTTAKSTHHSHRAGKPRTVLVASRPPRPRPPCCSRVQRAGRPARRRSRRHINPDDGGQAVIAQDCSEASGGKYTIQTSRCPAHASSQREQLARRLAAGDTSMDIMSLDPPFSAPELAEPGFRPSPRRTSWRPPPGHPRGSAAGRHVEPRAAAIPFLGQHPAAAVPGLRGQGRWAGHVQLVTGPDHQRRHRPRQQYLGVQDPRRVDVRVG